VKHPETAMTPASAHRNRLSGETSPYLLQHAANPVDWYPWGEEALARARAEDRPILLSIGYSACHWCHVMAHESFEDEATAGLMNRLYVNVKVDREERPDLDKIYQLSLQMLSHRGGGWPLTMVLTPDSLVPFFGGTYFPPEPRYGMPSFREVLAEVARFYRERRGEIEAQNAQLLEVLHSLGPRAPHTGEPDAAALDMARHQLEHGFDPLFGGFSGAPKFPHPPHLGRLLRHWASSERRGAPDRKALDMATFTLEKMARGGIYDHLGGGFCRYSVDAKWMIPHFEKMLYDNALLLPLYGEAWRVTGRPLFERVALETAGWVMREMQDPRGGYYSSLDADSEGEEGRYYVWSREEAQALLGAEDYAAFAARYGLDRPPNFEERWHLHAARPIAEVASILGRPEAAVREAIERARPRLLEARERRVRPGRDDKILTAWNGLMIRGMAMAARTLGRPDILRSAQRAADFARRELWRDGRLCVTFKDGRARLDAYLDDHAFLLDGLMELLQAEWRGADLAFAVALADALLARFEDRDSGGFFFTAEDHAAPMRRLKPFSDDALPAGNAVAALALQRLGHLLGEGRYLDAAARTLRAAWPHVSELPYAHDALLDALEEYLEPPELVVLRGPAGALEPWLRAARAAYRPERLCFAIARDAAGLPGLLAERRAPADGVLAYLCTGTTCRAPIADFETFVQAVGGTP
jgi:uncharacterized protein YyaL (SSP411 family)